MIVQTASLNILATNYDEASARDRKAGCSSRRLRGKAGRQGANRQRPRTFGVAADSGEAARRIPRRRPQAGPRRGGESRSNEEVSDQYVDLQARLKSARATEQRLIELLGTRTGKLQDVLEAERELARIRGEIESMQGQSALLVHRVNYATVQVELSEEYRQVLGSGAISTGTKMRNAARRGVQKPSRMARSRCWSSCLRPGPRSSSGWRSCWSPRGSLWKRFRRRAQS